MRLLLIIITFFNTLFALYPKYPLKVFLDPTIDYYQDKILIDGYLFESNRFSFKEYPFNDNKAYFLDKDKIVYINTYDLCIYNLKTETKVCKEYSNYIDALSVSKVKNYYAIGFGNKVLLFFKNRLYKTFIVGDKIRDIAIKNNKIFITYTPRKSSYLLDGYIEIYSLDGDLLFKNKIGKFALYPIVTDGEYLYHSDGVNVYITNIKTKRVNRGRLLGSYIFQDANKNFIVASTKKEFFILKKDFKGDEILYSSSTILPINLKSIKAASTKKEIKSIKIFNDKIFIFYKMGSFDIVDINLNPLTSYKPKDTTFISSIFLTKNSDLVIGYKSKVFRIYKDFNYTIFDTNCSISADIFYADKDKVFYSCYEKNEIKLNDNNLTIPINFEPTKAVIKDNFYYIGGMSLFKYNIIKFDNNFTKLKSFSFYPKKKGYIHDFFFQKNKKYFIETNWDKSYLEDEKGTLYSFKEQGEAKKFENGYIIYDKKEKKVVILNNNYKKLGFIKTKYYISKITANKKFIFLYQDFNPYHFLSLYRLNGKKVYDIFLFKDNSFAVVYPNGKIFTTKKDNLKYIFK